MPTLIIQIIAIVLISFASAAGTIYVSEAFTNNKIKSESAKYANESSQVLGAITSYESKGNMVDSSFRLQHLVDEKLLKSIPEGWKEYPGMIGTTIQGSQTQKESVCIETNKAAGYEFTPNGVSIKESVIDPAIGIPYCEPSLDKNVPCCIYAGY